MDLDIRKTRTCEKCKNVVTLDKVRLYPKDKDKNWLLCDNCCNELKNKMSTFSNAPSSLERKQVTNHVFIDRKEERVDSKKDLAKKFCMRCNYSFRVDPERVGILYNLKCPYCGKDDKVIDKKI